MAQIKNYDVYTARMHNSMYDKMFFVDKIFDENIDTILDFGCADGELIRHLHSFLPQHRFIGYDINDTMLEKARQNAPFAEFYNQWADIQVDPSRTIVNLSSVIHEVYHYAQGDDLAVFWKRLQEPGFAYIVIRDMFQNDAPLPYEDGWKEQVIRRGYGKKLEDFENCWGRIETVNQKIHFLLKYRYSENWEREVSENYMPISVGELERQMAKTGLYQIAYKSFAPLPFIVHKIAQDLQLDAAQFPTHLKIIFQRDL